MELEKAKKILLTIREPEHYVKLEEGQQAIDTVLNELEIKIQRCERLQKNIDIFNNVIELILDDMSHGDTVDKYVLRSKYFSKVLENKE